MIRSGSTASTQSPTTGSSGSTSRTHFSTTLCKLQSILILYRDIWSNAKQELQKEFGSKPKNADSWMASQRLIRILKSGMRECRDVEEKLKIVYGFEQVLPPASAYL